MLSRRRFLQSTAAAAAVIPRSVVNVHAGVQGANDRIRLGVIGTGTRGTMVAGFFARHKDCALVAACDVDKTRLDQFATKLTPAGTKLDVYEDYRRILERKDVDAVLVATPDHWHGPMTVEACAAGKDVYVEKPVSNAIEPAWKMVEAARKHNRVVQVGLQQRQGAHFKEAAKLVQDGLLGKVTHVVMQYGGAYTVPPEPSQPPPAGLNWELFQGPAPRRSYKPSRQRRWRTYYDYGGGLVTDWGVHLVDVAHWYLNLDAKAPRITTASAQYVSVENPERDQVPDAFIVSWQYDDVVMSFTNAVPATRDFGAQGTYFYGPRGCLQVHRQGFQVRPNPPRRLPGGPEPPPPIEARLRGFNENYEDDPDTIAHCRDFLDCIKSRQRPAGDIEIGFHSTLPCLLGLLAIRESRSVGWDGTSATQVPTSK
jgi:predicted dehydrogenase